MCSRARAVVTKIVNYYAAISLFYYLCNTKSNKNRLVVCVVLCVPVQSGRAILLWKVSKRSARTASWNNGSIFIFNFKSNTFYCKESDKNFIACAEFCVSLLHWTITNKQIFESCFKFPESDWRQKQIYYFKLWF
jgi:hypothetical protein